MMPGGRGLRNPRMAQRMMKQMGMSTEELDAVEVVIRLKGREIVLNPVSVTRMNVQGQVLYQVAGEERERAATGETPKKAHPAPAPVPAQPAEVFTDEDVKLVAEQAGVSEDEAREALEDSDGQTADAILKLMERKG